MRIADYSSIFSSRANQYISASSLWPQVRADEFAAFFDCLDLKDGERLLDAPCGPGDAFLLKPSTVEYVGLDPAADFVCACANRGATVVKSALRHTPFLANSFDVIGSLTGVHHEALRFELYAEWYRLLNEEGRLVLVDVWKGSRTDTFLNGFVNTWNTLGHSGDFLGNDDLLALHAAGFNRLEVRHLTYHWQALSDEVMHAFMSDLFGLDQQPDLFTMQQAWSYLGWQAEPHVCLVPWYLTGIIAKMK